MKFASSFDPVRVERKAAPAGAPASRPVAYNVPQWRTGRPYDDGWDVERAVREALEKVTWVFRAVDGIATAQSGRPVAVRQGDREKGMPVDGHWLSELLNGKPNPYEDAASFRHRISAILLLSKRGVFVEVQRTNAGDVYGLYILPPGYTAPVPDNRTFVAGYSVRVPGIPERVLSPDKVIWIRKPHPTDPYRGITPLEAAGLAVDMDWYARLYNRNFMLNDGRPGGILAVNGEMEDDVASELRVRFLGPAGNGINGAGRVSVIEAEDAKFVDTATTPRDAQYDLSRVRNKEEILFAFGAAESVLGNASGRTFSNADAEKASWWEDTIQPHNEVVARPFDALLEPGNHLGFDYTGVEALEQLRQARHAFLLDEYKAGAITLNMYLEGTGRQRIEDPDADRFFRDPRMLPVAEMLPEKKTPIAG